MAIRILGLLLKNQTAYVKIFKEAILRGSLVVKTGCNSQWAGGRLLPQLQLASIQLRCCLQKWCGAGRSGGGGWSSWEEWKRHSDAIDLPGSRRGQLPIYLCSPYHLSVGSPVSQPSCLFLCLTSRLPPALTFLILLQHLSRIDSTYFCHLSAWFVCSLFDLFVHVTSYHFFLVRRCHSFLCHSSLSCLLFMFSSVYRAITPTYRLCIGK